MRRHRHTTIRSLVLAGVTSAAFIAPGAAQARPSIDVNQTATPTIDLRSPDAAQPMTPAGVDLRSPDAATPVQLPAGRAVSAHHSSGGIDSRGLVIGAGAALVVALAGAGLTVTRRRDAQLGS
jgi:hypothetical protein